MADIIQKINECTEEHHLIRVVGAYMLENASDLNHFNKMSQELRDMDDRKKAIERDMRELINQGKDFRRFYEVSDKKQKELERGAK